MTVLIDEVTELAEIGKRCYLIAKERIWQPENVDWVPEQPAAAGRCAAGGCDGTSDKAIATRVARRAAWHRKRDTRKSRKPFPIPRPRIFPQGSMALGTTCKPVEGPHDLEFVLSNRYPSMAAASLQTRKNDRYSSAVRKPSGQCRVSCADLMQSLKYFTMSPREKLRTRCGQHERH